MAIEGAPQPWPSITTSASNDCLAGICTGFCPQFCVDNSVQPPPFTFFNPDGDNSSSGAISPLIAVLIALLAIAFVLLTSYIVISKYCNRRRNNSDWITGGRDHDDRLHQSGLESRLDQLIHESMNTNFSSPSAAASGLDDGFIKSITAFKYKRGDGLIDATDCAVCLNEFRDFESLRLMPNCQHAFHVECIDTWLKSHSNCPICRSAMIDSPLQRMSEVRVSAMRVGGGMSGGDVVVMVVRDDLEVVVCPREIGDSDDDGGDTSNERRGDVVGKGGRRRI